MDPKAKIRLKIILKWGVFLLLVGVVCLIAASFLVGFFGEIFYRNSYNQNVGTSIGSIVGMLAVLPFAYLFPYKAVKEYLEKVKAPKDQKNVGMVLGFGVVAISAIISTLLGWLLTGKMSYSLGFLPIILSIIAGYQAEKKFRKK